MRKRELVELELEQSRRQLVAAVVQPSVVHRSTERNRWWGGGTRRGGGGECKWLISSAVRLTSTWCFLRRNTRDRILGLVWSDFPSWKTPEIEIMPCRNIKRRRGRRRRKRGRRRRRARLKVQSMKLVTETATEPELIEMCRKQMLTRVSRASTDTAAFNYLHTRT